MAILTQEQYMSRIQSIIGDDNSDEALAFIEDMRDTYNNHVTLLGNRDSENWEEKYKQNDAEWRERYRKAFFESPTEETINSLNSEIKIIDLFTEVKHGN